MSGSSSKSYDRSSSSSDAEMDVAMSGSPSESSDNSSSSSDDEMDVAMSVDSDPKKAYRSGKEGGEGGQAYRSYEPSRFTSWFTKFSARFHQTLYLWFRRLAVSVFDHPMALIGLTTLIGILCTLGLLLTIDVRTEAEEIWVPQSSESIELRDRLRELWPKEATPMVVQASARDGGDALRPSILLELLEIHNRVVGLTATDEVGAALTYANMCQIAPGATSCSFSHPVLWWDMNSTLVLEDPSLRSTLSSNPFAASGDGLTQVSRDQLFKENADGTVKSMLAIWFISDVNSDQRIAFEGEFLDFMASAVQRSNDKEFSHPDGFLRECEVVYFAERTIDDELGEAVGGDIPLFAAAMTAMFVYSSLALSRWNWRETKFTVALGGMLSVGLSIGSGFGFSSMIGIMFTSLTPILPFVLVGIGVDDMFVMIDAVYYQRVWPTSEQLAKLGEAGRHQTLRKLFSEGVAEAGAAITVTSLTNAAAFFLSALTAIPATSAFTLYAGFGVLFDFFFQVTFFAAIVALDIRRMSKDRVELLPCMAKAVKNVEDDHAHAPEHTQPALVRRLLVGYSNFLMKTPVRVAVIPIFLILTALGGLGASQLQQGLPLADLATDGSYLIDYQEANLRDFNGPPTVLSVLFDEAGFDYAALDTQRQIESLTAELEQFDFSFGDKRATFSWIRALAGFVAATSPADIIADAQCPIPGCVRPSEFYRHLQAFLADPRSVAFLERSLELAAGALDSPAATWTSQSIIASRILITFRGVGDETERVDAMVEIKDVQEKYRDDHGLPVSCHATYFTFVEPDLIQVNETLISLSLAIVAVWIFATALLVHPLLGVYVALTIAMIDVQLFGWMYMLGIRFNTIGITNLAMAIGLSFDFVGHIAHGFIDNGLTDRIEKVKDSLSRMGVSVFHGGVTTFLGVMFLSNAGSVIFRVFFQMFAGIVVLSLLHAFIFLPVLLSFIGPRMPLHAPPATKAKR